MALSAAIVWEQRPGAGSANNGGGFNPGVGGTDRSQQNAAHATLTILSTVHTTTTQINVSATNYTVTAGDIGNILNITGGTATAGRYEITAVDTANNRWTLDRSAGIATQTVAGSMGGAVAALGTIASTVVAGNTIYIKAGTDTFSGNVTVTAGTLSAPVRIIGYNATRGDLTSGGTYAATHTTAGFLDTTNFPTLAIGANALTLGSHTRTEGLNFTGSRNAAIVASGSNAAVIFRCKSVNTNTGASTAAVNGTSLCIDCDFGSTGVSGSYTVTGNTAQFQNCRITSTNGGGITTGTNLYVNECIFYSMAASQNAINLTAGSPTFYATGCTFYNILGTCVALGNQALTTPLIVLINNQVSGCGTFANNLRSATQLVPFYGFHNRIRDTTTTYTGWIDDGASINDVLTDDSDAGEYVNAGSNDFHLTAAALGLGAGLPNPRAIGAWQRAASGGGGISRARLVNSGGV